jgi:hypothetical protein
MKAGRSILLAMVLTAGLCVAPSTKAALTQCGAKDPKTHELKRAVLTLDPQSVTTISYKRATGVRTLNFIFKAAGCDLGTSQANPDTDLLPKQGADEVPDGVVTFKKATPDGSEFTVKFTVDSAKLKARSYVVSQRFERHTSSRVGRR